MMNLGRGEEIYMTIFEQVNNLMSLNCIQIGTTLNLHFDMVIRYNELRP